MEDEEALQTGALVSLPTGRRNKSSILSKSHSGKGLNSNHFSDLVENCVDDLLSNCVVTSSVVVGCIFLSTDQLLGVEQLPVASSAHHI